MRSAIIVKPRRTIAFSVSDPLGLNGPVEEPASLGMKVEIDGKQYGWWFDEEGMRSLGVTIERGGGGTYFGMIRPLVEGVAPEAEEVPW